MLQASAVILDYFLSFNLGVSHAEKNDFELEIASLYRLNILESGAMSVCYCLVFYCVVFLVFLNIHLVPSKLKL